ncbi:MAG: hypothetical protein H6Q69_1790 [Firmicutes bacterium]|nr:hypothetical protein [Bacillota bacterium]
MSENTTTVTTVTEAVVSAVATAAVSTLEEKRVELVAKIEAKLAESDISIKNKILYNLYLTLVKTAGDALVEKIAAKIA